MHLSAYVIQQTPLLFKIAYAWVSVAYAQTRESWLIYIDLPHGVMKLKWHLGPGLGWGKQGTWGARPKKAFTFRVCHLQHMNDSKNEHRSERCLLGDCLSSSHPHPAWYMVSNQQMSIALLWISDISLGCLQHGVIQSRLRSPSHLLVSFLIWTFAWGFCPFPVFILTEPSS